MKIFWNLAKINPKSFIFLLICKFFALLGAAMRVADVGIALRQGQSSLVSAFTAKQKSLQVVVDVLRHGRACLATLIGMLLFGWVHISTDLVSLAGVNLIAPQFAGYTMLLTNIKIICIWLLIFVMIFASTPKNLAKRFLSPHILTMRKVTWILVQFCIGITALGLLLFAVFPQSLLTNEALQHMRTEGLYKLGRPEIYQTPEASMHFLWSIWFLSTLALASTCFSGHETWTIVRTPYMVALCLAMKILIMMIIWGGPSAFHCMLGLNCDNRSSFHYSGKCLFGGQIPLLFQAMDVNEFQEPTPENGCRYYKNDVPDFEEEMTAIEFSTFPPGMTAGQCVGPHNCLPDDVRVWSTITLFIMTALSLVTSWVVHVSTRRDTPFLERPFQHADPASGSI